MSFINPLHLLIGWAAMASGLAVYLGAYLWRLIRQQPAPAELSDLSYRQIAQATAAMQLPPEILGSFENRIFPQIQRLNSYSANARRWNRDIIIGSIGIDFVVTLLAAAIGQFSIPQLNLLIIGLSASQAAIKALHEHFQFQVIWLTHRQTVEAAKSEIWRFVSGVDEYSGKNFVAAAKDCISQVEGIFEASNQQILSRHRQTQQSQKGQGEPLATEVGISKASPLTAPISAPEPSFSQNSP